MTTNTVEVVQEDRPKYDLDLCPWCGGPADYECLENGRFSVGCNDIDSECLGFQLMTTFATKREARTAWNTRINSEKALAERVREALDAYDETYGKCPFSPSHRGNAVAYGDPCPKCRATPRDACHLGAAAGAQFVASIRDLDQVKGVGIRD